MISEKKLVCKNSDRISVEVLAINGNIMIADHGPTGTTHPALNCASSVVLKNVSCALGLRIPGSGE